VTLVRVPAEGPGAPELAYVEAGPRDGAPLVLLHSLGTDRRIWAGQLEALARDHRVLAVDSRGHGASGWAAPVDLAGWVADLDRVLAFAGIEEVTLAGLSMGGVQALAYAQQRGERVRALVLADTFAELEPALAERKTSELASLAREHGMAALADAYVEETFTAGPRPAGAKAVRDAIARMPADAYVGSAEACFGARLGTGLHRIAAPALVLWGTRDAKTPRPLAERLASGLPNAVLEEVPGAGHLANLENPRAFTRAVRAFLRDAGVAPRPRAAVGEA
jgi:3-oxoadipate enol-lactonase